MSGPRNKSFHSQGLHWLWKKKKKEERKVVFWLFTKYDVSFLSVHAKTPSSPFTFTSVTNNVGDLKFTWKREIIQIFYILYRRKFENWIYSMSLWAVPKFNSGRFQRQNSATSCSTVFQVTPQLPKDVDEQYIQIRLNRKKTAPYSSCLRPAHQSCTPLYEKLSTAHFAHVWWLSCLSGFPPPSQKKNELFTMQLNNTPRNWRSVLGPCVYLAHFDGRGVKRV